MTTSKMSPTEGHKTYEQQRRERLSDAINDYMCFDDFDPRQCYEEIIAEVISARDYHDKMREKANSLLTLLTRGNSSAGAARSRLSEQSWS